MIGLNPPLRVGQILRPRPDSKFPVCRIVQGLPSCNGMVWTLEPVDGGNQVKMTLSDIYARFEFEF